MTAPSVWLSSNAYSVGDLVRPATDIGTGFYFRATVAGTTGTVEPFWPTIIENTVQDGTVTWMAVSIVAGDMQTPAPSAIIELFALQLFTDIHGVNTTYRFHAGTNLVNDGEVVWKGNSYLRFPIEADGFEYNGQGTLPRPKIRVSNILGTITSILLSLPNGLEAAKVTRIRTLAKYLDAVNFPAPGFLLLEDGDNLLLEDGSSFQLEPVNATEDYTAEFPQEIYYIDRKTAENRELVEFEMVAAFDLAGVRAPKRQCISNVCQWVYKSAECGYTPVASFTGTYSRTSPSTTLTVTAAAHGLSPGDQVHLTFTTGTALTGSYTVRTAASGSFTITTVATTTTSGNVTATQWYDTGDVPTTVASLDVCAKRLTSCQSRFGSNSELPYGSFPGIGSTTS